MTQPKKTNRLATAKSPYLKLHAGNPVDWFSWGPEALEKARAENKPILLSIGYAACHWCHVMAHESFDDAETASMMNRNFVNIKVDREERPDLDKIYQTVHQLITGRGGGWPLTIFLAPDQTPFFAGTYYPKEPRYGMITFKQLLEYLAQYYATHHQEITQHSTELRRILNDLNQLQSSQSSPLSLHPWDLAQQQISQLFDPIYGGFGGAPKFFHPSFSEFLLYQWHDQKNSKSLEIVTDTLNKISEGGIFDQLGGGFFRYSVDEKWLIPHFEKMLYDNAQLLTLYVQAFRITQNPKFAHTVNEIADWVLREMRSPEGAFYASLNADSEGEEGKSYYWDRNEIKNLLTQDEFEVCTRYFGFDQPENFENHWHLFVAKNIASVASELKITPEKTEQLITSIRKKLFTARQKRIQPSRDDKILTSWNALMIKALALAGEYLNRPDLLTAAQQAFKFISTELFKEGQLSACYGEGQAYLSAYLDDYAFLLDAGLTLLQLHFKTSDLKFLITLSDSLLTEFYDPENGGFFFTAHTHEKLIYRPKVFEDEVMPSGNAIATVSLLRMGYLLGNDRYLKACEKTLQAIWPQLEKNPNFYCSFLIALREFLTPTQIIKITGDVKNLNSWRDTCLNAFHPERICLIIPNTIKDLPKSLELAMTSNPVAYVCEGTQCREPIDNLADLEQLT